MLTMGEIAAFKAQLEKAQGELAAREKDGQDERATVTLDQQSVGRLSRMDALQRQQMAKETERRRKLAAAKIAAALDRISEKEYGWCVDCGLPIAKKRLEADPTHARCVECAE